MRKGWENKTRIIVYLQNSDCRYNWGITGAPLLPTCQAVGAVAYLESSPPLLQSRSQTRGSWCAPFAPPSALLLPPRAGKGLSPRPACPGWGQQVSLLFFLPFLKCSPRASGGYSSVAPVMGHEPSPPPRTPSEVSPMLLREVGCHGNWALTFPLPSEQPHLAQDCWWAPAQGVLPPSPPQNAGSPLLLAPLHSPPGSKFSHSQLARLLFKPPRALYSLAPVPSSVPAHL